MGCGRCGVLPARGGLPPRLDDADLDQPSRRAVSVSPWVARGRSGRRRARRQLARGGRRFRSATGVARAAGADRSRKYQLHYRVRGAGGRVREVSLGRRRSASSVLVPSTSRSSRWWVCVPVRWARWSGGCARSRGSLGVRALRVFVAVQPLQLACSPTRRPAGYERLADQLFRWSAPPRFHLFTVYPIEPPWVARHRWVRLVLYGDGRCVAALVTGRRALTAYPFFAIASSASRWSRRSSGSGS